MLQKKFLFNQSSVSLEIIGLPDYSNDENNDQISIVSQWKLMIIDKPLIEGNLDHLGSVMDAFYSYSDSLMNGEIGLFKSNLIDIKPENYCTHNILLKSSKPDVKPLNIKIGNSVLPDIINCFDQLCFSNKVKNIYSKDYKNLKKKKYLHLFNKNKILNNIIPPVISLCSIFLFSTTFIYLNNLNDNDDKRSSLNNINKLISIKSASTIV